MIRPLIRDHLADLLYPSACGACGRQFVLPVCPWCFKQIAASGRGEDLDKGDLPCRVVFTAYRAAGDYAGPLKDLVLEFKDSRRGLAPALAALMALAAGNDPEYLLPAGVCFVPSSRGKVAARGYNPAELLARHLAGILGRPLYDALVVLRETDQGTASGAARSDNVAGAFGPRDRVRLRGAVLLVDDVLTTGATANECAACLLSCGADSVRVLVAARAIPKNHPKGHSSRPEGVFDRRFLTQ